ncbi:queuosine precursor transporter [Candidatus Saccharibacteria bacterium]|nr:queuosine precursor transporter [Candidatus Saccharibacteria bacterium]
MKLLKYQRLDILFAIYIASVILMNLMGAKVMPLGSFLGFNFNISVAIVLMPLLFSITDAVCEVYNKERAKSMVNAGIVTVAFMTLFATFAVAMPSAERFLPMEAAYNQIFTISIRFGLASLTAFAISAIMNLLVFSKLKARHGEGRLLWFRNNVSDWSAQFMDSTIFVVLAFWTVGIGFGANANFMVSIIIPLTIAKCAMSLVTTPVVYAFVKFLKAKQDEKETVKAAALVSATK